MMDVAFCGEALISTREVTESLGVILEPRSRAQQRPDVRSTVAADTAVPRGLCLPLDPPSG
jgi:hypothetical protein